eukprot:TRINITY_DN8792_c1_g1_i1.p1 TRINITY_DN8792_c1_g1~~TRINITY_DN8792_c1_g1_i1.p1  ORF type:complete len:123 (+),score=3.86 TRINITY_DN8792_c1_g1_i1:37-369(+)
MCFCALSTSHASPNPRACDNWYQSEDPHHSDPSPIGSEPTHLPSPSHSIPVPSFAPSSSLSLPNLATRNPRHPLLQPYIPKKSPRLDTQFCQTLNSQNLPESKPTKTHPH